MLFTARLFSSVLVKAKKILPPVFLLVLSAFLIQVSTSVADEICSVCDRKVVVTGQFKHGHDLEKLTIENAPKRMEEAFREEIHGPNFSVSVPHLPAGKYTVRIGLAEVDYLAAGQRLFDIMSGDQVIETNLDIFATAGGAGRVYILTATIDHPGDALRGPLTLVFTGVTNDAKLNTFEVRDGSKTSLISFSAADLINSEDSSAIVPPTVTTPEIWKDPSQPREARVRDLISRMSLAEKVQEMRNGAAGIPRLGVPAYDYWSECLHGVGRAGIATVFPQAIGMAATWDTSLLHDVADTIATEARAKHNDYIAKHNGDAARYYGLTFWTPNINIFRDPRWGRGQETYGEDTFLTSRLGVAFIRGLQGDDPDHLKAMACAKHFAVHSGPESERHSFDVEPAERDFYETYLPHFEAAVREGHVGAVMGAYNSVYGLPACANPLLLNDLLRKQWGFDGHVVSDCGAIYDIYANHKTVGSSEEAAAIAVKAGDDLCCGTDYNSLTRAVKSGLISESDIDVAVGRLFDARFRLGMFDPPDKDPYAGITLAQNDTPEHEVLALKTARESIVLLKNNGVLPLDRTKIKRIAVLGGNADSVAMLLGNYNGTPARPVTILDGIKAVAGNGIEVVSETNFIYPLALKSQDDPEPVDEMEKTLEAAQKADVIIYVGGISPQLEGEEMHVNFDGFSGGDRTRIELPVIQTDLLKALYATVKPVVFVNCSGGSMAMPWEATNLPAIVQAWYPGEQGGRAVADVLFGDVNPSGRLPITFYRATSDLPAFEDYSMTNRTYRYFTGSPLFAFGHGLSYTKFDYADAALDHVKIGNGQPVKLSFTLKNSGTADGDEVAQVYFRHVNSAVSQPRMALCGFARVSIPKGKTARISMEIPAERFRYWDTAKKQYVVEAGDYELMVGAASDDIRLHAPLKIAAK